MCWAMIGLAALSALKGGISSYFETKAQNSAVKAQYQAAQENQRRVTAAALEQYNAQQSLNRQGMMRQAAEQADTTRKQLLENRQRQATALASAASSGLTGVPLANIFGSYEQASGDLTSSGAAAQQGLLENLFFNNDSARRQAQSTINQSVPAKPYFASWSPLPMLLDFGLGVAGGAMRGGFGSKPVAINPGTGAAGGGGSVH